MDENEYEMALWASQQDPSTLGPYDLSLRQKYIDMFGLGGQSAPAPVADPRYSGLYSGSKTSVPYDLNENGNRSYVQQLTDAQRLEDPQLRDGLAVSARSSPEALRSWYDSYLRGNLNPQPGLGGSYFKNPPTNEELNSLVAVFSMGQQGSRHPLFQDVSLDSGQFYNNGDSAAEIDPQKQMMWELMSREGYASGDRLSGASKEWYNNFQANRGGSDYFTLAIPAIAGAIALGGMATGAAPGYTGFSAAGAAGGGVDSLELGMAHSADLAAAGGSEVASGSGLAAWQSGALGGSGGAPAGSAAAATTAGMTGLGLPAGAVAGTAGLTAAGAGAGAGLGGALTSGGAMGLLGDVLPSVVGAGASIYGYKEYADAMKEAARLQVEQADRALAAQQEALKQTLALQQQAVAQGRQDIAAQLQPQIQALQQGTQNAMAQYQQAAQQAQASVESGYSQAERTMRGVAGDVDARSQILSRDISNLYGQAGQQARGDLTAQSQAAQNLYGQGTQNYLSQLGQGAQQARTDIGQGYTQAGQALQTGEQDFLGRLGAGAQQARGDISGGYQQALGALDPYAAGARQAYDAALQGALNPNSELYRLQQEDLEKSINRQMAARGMYGSGAALELQANQMRRLAAEEAQRRYERQVQMSQILPQAAQAQSGLYQQQGQQLGNLDFQQGQLGAGAAQQFGMARADLGTRQGEQLSNLAMQQGQLGAGAMERGYGAQAAQAAQLGGQLAETGMQTAAAQGGAQQQIGLGNIGTQAQVGMGLGEMAGQKGIDMARIYAALGQQAGGTQEQMGTNLSNLYGNYGTNMANITTGSAAQQQQAIANAANRSSDIYTGLGTGLSANRADRGQALGNMYTNLGQYGASAMERVFSPKPRQNYTGLYPYS